MKRSKLEWSIRRELKRIQEGIPEELLVGLMKKEKISPTIKQLVEKALKLPEDQTTPEQRQRFQVLIDSGFLDREIEVLDHDKEKLLDQYFEAEIALSVKAGRLPKEAPALILKNNKGKNYDRKQTERLKELFSPDGSPDGDEASDDLQHPLADSERGPADRDVQAPEEQGGREGEAREDRP